jgi:MFS family permease
VIDALAEPADRVARGWVARMTVASIGLWAAFFGPIQVLLAQQAAALAPDHKEAVFGLVTGLGAAVSLVANPLFGALSDRTTSRLGRRRPWIAGGALAGAASLLLLAWAPNVAVMAVGWCLAQAALNAMLAALTAVVPDQVPLRQRGVIGGWVGVAQTLGVLGGVGLAVATGGITAGFLACAAFLVVTAAPFVLRTRDATLRRADRPTLRQREFVRGFWISPRRHPDFGWAWATRFLINLGNAIGTLYLLFYLDDAVGYHDPEAGVFILVLLYSAALLSTTVVSGVWSDRVGRRKVFVTVSGVVVATAAAMLALWPTWPAAVAAALVLGAGFGVYTSVDFALLTQVLPVAADRAKDLGVVNIANSLPQVLAPAVAAPVVSTAGGYPALYAVSATVGLAGAVLVRQIRGVR